MCGKAGGQRRERSDRVYEMTTEKEKNEYLTSGEGRCGVMYCHVRCAWEREMWYIVLSRAVRVITIS